MWLLIIITPTYTSLTSSPMPTCTHDFTRKFHWFHKVLQQLLPSSVDCGIPFFLVTLQHTLPFETSFTKLLFLISSLPVRYTQSFRFSCFHVSYCRDRFTTHWWRLHTLYPLHTVLLLYIEKEAKNTSLPSESLLSSLSLVHQIQNFLLISSHTLHTTVHRTLDFNVHYTMFTSSR